ncbi:MAG: penicillin-binding transpeptidase domain-containing protein, partial [Pseudomonadota bacterium]
PEPVIEGASLGVSERNLRLVQEAMSAVSNEAGGTAFRSRIVDPDMLVAGKTGTAQVRRIRTAERESGVRKNEELPWRLRDHALFVAYAPVAAPRYAISVVVEHGGSGSKSAAPIARDILIRALYGPTPPLESYPANVRAQIEAAWAAADRAQAAGETTDGAFMWGVDGAGEPAAPSDFG